jgi:hypothetical protein
MFDLESLLRMDSATLMTTIKDAIGAGVMKPNEGRNKLNLAPVEGGDTPYLQQQNYSLAALDKRDTAAPAPSDAAPTPTAPAAKPPADEADEPPASDDKALLRDALLGKVLRKLSAAGTLHHAA